MHSRLYVIYDIFHFEYALLQGFLLRSHFLALSATSESRIFSINHRKCYESKTGNRIMIFFHVPGKAFKMVRCPEQYFFIVICIIINPKSLLEVSSVFIMSPRGLHKINLTECDKLKLTGKDNCDTFAHALVKWLLLLRETITQHKFRIIILAPTCSLGRKNTMETHSQLRKWDGLTILQRFLKVIFNIGSHLNFADHIINSIIYQRIFGKKKIDKNDPSQFFDKNLCRFTQHWEVHRVY